MLSSSPQREGLSQIDRGYFTYSIEVNVFAVFLHSSDSEAETRWFFLGFSSQAAAELRIRNCNSGFDGSESCRHTYCMPLSRNLLLIELDVSNQLKERLRL